MTKTVLVTGASGWLGTNLIHTLLRDSQADTTIRCLVPPGVDGSALKALSERIEVVQGDVRSAADAKRFCERADGAVLFHLAGIIHPRRVSEFSEVNVRGTENLVEAAISEGLRRVVVTSSNSPCGNNPRPDHQFDEDSSYHPYMGYGRSKMHMEQSVARLCVKGGVESVIVRAPWFYGPFQPDRQTLFFRMIREGKFPIVGSGENLRSMVYVDNLCLGLLLAATRGPAKASIYWIADRRPYSMNEIVATVRRLLSDEFGLACSGKALRLPGLASEVAGWADAAIQRTGFYHQKIHVLSEMNKTIVCSIAKARRDLGYEPTVDLEEGMRRSIAWAISRKVAI